MATNCKIVSHQSALAYWISANPASENYASPTREKPLRKPARTLQELEGFNIEHPLFGGRPVHLLVPQKSFARSSENVICHVGCYALPNGSIWKLKDGLFVVSPELCFAQLGRSLGDAQLAYAAIALCGDFFMPPVSGRIEQRNHPLTSLQQLKEYLCLVESIRGVQRAAKSLQYASEHAASPMEIMLFLLLTLPKRLGGYGICKAKLNYRIDPGKQGVLAEQRYYLADLCWPEQKLVVEYDGEDYHQDASHDKRRTNALESLGWRVLCVTKSELYDPARFHTVALQVAHALGVRIRLPDSWNQIMLQLRIDLNSMHL